MAEINLPALPASHDSFLQYIEQHPEKPMPKLLEPFKEYDAELRKIFAQQPDHPAVKTSHVVPVFAGHENTVRVRARDVRSESEQETQQYIMPLKDEDRKPNGAPAIVQSLQQFRTNFNVFSESSLADLDWTNVVAAGSAVVTSLLAVPEKHAESKRALRTYYHEQLAPASDVDLFLYGLTEEQAIEKIRQIERQVRDALLVETTTVRTKNTITICSQYPTRHVQIVLRIYKSVSEILAGFDVDCSCAAYDGKQVYASPRALVSYMTQVNTIDLSRRSPSYENRLSKYAKRGFEVHWPNLDRSRVDPTIFERSFGRTQGLARLLILEKLPKTEDREAYLDQRRAERGRPPINRWRMRKRMIYGNVKNDHEDEVAEWVDSDEVADYHTFTIPYGPKFHSKKIEKLLYTKDMLLNAEWNKPKDRAVDLHRHPAFFGRVDDVIYDCCGHCPQPSTVEEEEVAEQEGKIYVKGDIAFIRDDPGRQAVGSFNPLTADDWTEMAYVSNTGMLCQAIVEGDAEYVHSWLQQDGNDPNARDYTGKTPLHLAVANSTLEIVQMLIDGGSRLIARLVDGQTALHLAAKRGSVEMVSALLRKSEANEAEEEAKTEKKRAGRRAAKDQGSVPVDTKIQGAPDREPDSQAASGESSDVDMLDDATDAEAVDATTEESLVNIKTPNNGADDELLANEENEEEADVYDVNILAWDTAASALHLAIVHGHVDVVKCMVQDHGADVLLPIKLVNDHDKSARAAILTLVLALQLPKEKASEMAQTLINLGATLAQADLDQTTVLQYAIADRPDQLGTLAGADRTGLNRAINNLSVSGYRWNAQVSGPLLSAIQARDATTALELLSAGAKAEISFSDYMKAYKTKHDPSQDSKQNQRIFESSQQQPVFCAVECELPSVAQALVSKHGANPNTLSKQGYEVLQHKYTRRYTKGESLLDVVRQKVKSLREWKYEKPQHTPPTPLEDHASYLSAYTEGTYAHWSAQDQLLSAKKKYDEQLEAHNKAVEASDDTTGTAEKQTRVSALAEEFEQLEAALLGIGAKTLEELHPDIEKPDEHQRMFSGYEPTRPEPFKIDFTFGLGDLTDEGRDRYMQLFDAAWVGDLTTVKRLTLLPWTDSSGEDQPPLQVAVADQHALSTFDIATVRGHTDVAVAILEISQAQYVVLDGSKQERYRLDGDTDGEEIGLYSEIVDDEFTIETIGEVSMQVESHTHPLHLIRGSSAALTSIAPQKISTPFSMEGFSYFGPRKSSTMASMPASKTSRHHLRPPLGISERRWELEQPDSLIQYALYIGDEGLLTFLLDQGQSHLQHYLKTSSADTDSMMSFFDVSEDDFIYAIKADRPHLVELLVRRAGAGIRISELAEKFGAEVKEKPRYYQGLSVYGSKRKDWAESSRGRHHYGGFDNEEQRPPLLRAAFEGSLKTVEWFLSDAPVRCYNQFAEQNKDDKRLQRLAQAADGFETLTKTFLTARSDLIIHCYIMGNRTSDDDGAMLQYLISTMPDAVDVRSAEGLTPLMVALELYDHLAAKMLIDAGADQSARDKSGNNILHRLLHRTIDSEKDLKKLEAMLGLIDKRLLPSLFLERSASHPGSLTPLAKWLTKVHGGLHRADEDAPPTLRLLLRYGGGRELSHIDGQGDTPLHVAVKENMFEVARIMLEHDPLLLNRENAVGRTPYEVAEDAAIAVVCSDPPPLPGGSDYGMRKARRYGLSTGWWGDVINRTPKDFVEAIDVDRRNNREKIWDLARDVKQKLEAEGQAKRRLVTLNEANEVARRLAAVKAGSSRQASQLDDGGYYVRTKEVRDEVREWLSGAERRV